MLSKTEKQLRHRCPGIVIVPSLCHACLKHPYCCRHWQKHHCITFVSILVFSYRTSEKKQLFEGGNKQVLTMDKNKSSTEFHRVLKDTFYCI